MSLYRSILNLFYIFRRDQLYNVIQESNRPRLPLIESFDWNLDVTLTTAYRNL
jgi:hypothetical protein